jgi:two-component system response regulator YesN
VYRVMIVDDEQPVLDSFSHVIRKYGGEFDLAGACLSGEEAIGLIPALKPDLVFMDVNMPGLDGIETIRHIGERHPEILFILATAYERFDIARKVIPLNVLGYLVKPVTRPRLLAELDRASAQLAARKAGGGIREAAGRPVERRIRDSLLLALSGAEGGAGWEDFRTLAGLPGGEPALAIAVPRGANPDALSDVRRTLEYKIQGHSEEIAGRLVILPADTPENRSGNLGERLRELCEGRCEVHWSGFVPAEELPRRYRALLLQAGPAEDLSLSESERIQRDVRRLMRRPIEGRPELLREIWTGIFSLHDFTSAKCLMVAVLTLYIHNSGLSDAMVAGHELAPAAEIAPLADLSEWEDWIGSASRRLFSRFGAGDPQSLPRGVQAAVDIVRQRFGEALQLSDVAAECRMSDSHLSRLFSRHLGCGFAEYLNRYRIGIAENLLGEGTMSIKEVSHAVGYRDPNYFSRIYRKYRGAAPSQLRQEDE